MYKAFALFLIVSQLFINVGCLNSNLWRRQDSPSGSPSTPPGPSAPSVPSNSTNATAAIVFALDEDGIPESCDSACISPYNTTLTCQSVTCRCTNDYAKSLFDCYLCAGNFLHASFDTVQGIIDALDRDCFQLGFNLTELTFPGENPNRVIISSLTTGSFTLTLPTPAQTDTQEVGSHPQVTQGTTSDNGASPDSEPVSKNDSCKNMVTSGNMISLALMILGALGLLSS